MTVTTHRTATYRRTVENAGDLIDDVAVNPLPSANGIVGWYMRLEDGGKERIWNPVVCGATSNLYPTALLVCNEDGSWF